MNRWQPTASLHKEAGQACVLQGETVGWLRKQSADCAFHRMLKLARTIADLAGSDTIQAAHIA